MSQKRPRSLDSQYPLMISVCLQLGVNCARGFQTTLVAYFLFPYGAIQADFLLSSSAPSNLIPYGIRGPMGGDRCVGRQIMSAQAGIIPDYWVAQKMQILQLMRYVESWWDTWETESQPPCEKEGVHVTTHIEGILRKETTSWQLWALGNSCQTQALWLVFLGQNRSM